MGMAPTNLRAFKAQMAACTRARKLGVSVIVALAMQGGQAADPEYYMRHELFSCWFNIWRSCPEHRDLLTRAWAKLKPSLCGANRCKRVTGHLGVVIATLVDIGWKPNALVQWDDNTGSLWSSTLVTQALIGPFVTSCKNASVRRPGSGRQIFATAKVFRKELIEQLSLGICVTMRK